MQSAAVVPYGATPMSSSQRRALRLDALRHDGLIQSRLPSLHPIDQSRRYEQSHAFSSYANWIIPGHVMVGRYPYLELSRCVIPDRGVAQLKQILESGIRTFVCLQEEIPGQRQMAPFPVSGFHPYVKRCEDMAPGGIDTVHFPIVDLSVPDPASLSEALRDVEGRIVGGEKIYMHCWGGRGRAGLVACCLLAQSFKISADEALQRVGRAFSTRQDGDNRSPETREQFAFVRDFVANYC